MISARVTRRTAYSSPIARERNKYDCIRAVHPVAMRSATGPGSMFDESPTEPITEAQKQISQQLMDAMKQKIADALEAESVVVEDIYGNNQHVNIEVVSNSFEDKSAVQRQRLVYKVPPYPCSLELQL